MKQLVMLAGCVSLLLFSGCQKAGCQKPDSQVKNTTAQAAKFPAVMVGRWEAKAAGPTWVFDIRPDGSIVWMWHTMAGEVNFTDGETQIEKNETPIHKEYFLSPCEAKYDPATNEVSIEVVMDYYRIQSRIQSVGKAVEGGRTDVFKGALSKDGKTWNAGWLMSLEFEGKKTLKSRKPQPIVFTKVDAK